MHHSVTKINPLHYLRGLAALGIMMHHYFGFPFQGSGSSENFLARVGVYAVSIFYVLSGLTLFHVYESKLWNGTRDILYFYWKRFIRIFPLLWLATFLTILVQMKIPDAKAIFLNLTGLFGFFSFDAGIAQGTWSIGNELVFYSIFPLILLLLKHKHLAGKFMLLLFFAVATFHGLTSLDPNQRFSEQWLDFIHPMNQIYLFLGGIVIGVWTKNRTIPKWILMSLPLLCLIIFIFYPATGDLINVATGFNRLLFSLLCFGICTALYKVELKLPPIGHKAFFQLGAMSYSVYLLHPIISHAIVYIESMFFTYFDAYLLVAIATPCTLIASYFSYHYFEKKWLDRGTAMAHKKMSQE